jgi:hypothetical protein
MKHQFIERFIKRKNTILDEGVSKYVLMVIRGTSINYARNKTKDKLLLEDKLHQESLDIERN